jgi:terminase small subunit-like protein
MGREKRPKNVKKKKADKPLTLKQSRFAAAFMKSHSLKQAALAAGYSPKHPSKSGQQALDDIRHKAPKILESMGLSLENVIEKHLIPLLNATETKFFQSEGKITDYVDVEALGIQLGATRTTLELLNAFPPKDPILAAQVGVEVIVMDMPRPEPPSGDGRSANGHKAQKAKVIEQPPVDPRPKD